MVKKDTLEISLNSVDYIIRHPWLFVSPIVIIMSLVLSYLGSTKLDYECSAILAFKSAGGTLLGQEFIEKKKVLVEGILIGENIRNLIKEVWPEENEEKDPTRYNALMKRLRNPNRGIKTWYDKKGQDILNISFVHTDSQICYKVVVATIDTIKKATKRETEQEIGAGIVFLKKQLEFYKSRLEEIDEEASSIKIDLRKEYPNMSEEEKDLLDETLGSSAQISDNARAQAKAQQVVGYAQRLADLNLQLLGLQRQKATLEAQLKKGDVETLALSLREKDVESDTALQRYNQAIANKELAMTEFFAQGFLPEHPQIRKLQIEIENLSALRDKRLEELRNPAASFATRRALEESVKKKMSNYDAQIDILKLKIKVLENYKSASEEELKPTGVRVNIISAKTSRLMELKGEKEISQKYYNEIRRQLEVGEIKSRLEQDKAGIEVVIIEEPKVPLKPIPLQHARRIFLGFIVSVTAGIGLAYLVDILDNSIKSTSELRELLQVPVLASIDKLNTVREVRAKQFRRNLLIIALVAFVAISRIVMRFMLR